MESRTLYHVTQTQPPTLTPAEQAERDRLQATIDDLNRQIRQEAARLMVNLQTVLTLKLMESGNGKR